MIIARAPTRKQLKYWESLKGIPPKHIDNTGKRNSPETEIKSGQRLSSATEFKKGCEPWNKGKKIRYIPHFGHRGKLAGDKHPQWKGGIAVVNDKARKTPEYREWRKSVFHRDDYTCQICGERGCYLHADHIKPFSKYTDLRYEISNGRTLCAHCHTETDTFGGRCS